MGSLFQQILTAQSDGRKQLAVLIDPDKIQGKHSLENLLTDCEKAQVDFLFVGGSLLLNDQFGLILSQIKNLTDIPVIIFPGSTYQISAAADGILFLSLISGRNPDLLIGQQVHAAPLVKSAGIEPLSTGYMLVDCGNATTASYISNTDPLPYHKPEIAACTAMAGEMLGNDLLYLDGGSGAKQPISEEMIRKVSSSIIAPLIVGGGIRCEADAERAWNAGTQILVVGNAIEDNLEFLSELAVAKTTVNTH